MSALPPNSGHQRHAIAALFDHLVGERKQPVRNFEAERLGGLEIEHELEFGGPHDRQVARLLALENPPGVDAGLAIGIGLLVP